MSEVDWDKILNTTSSVLDVLQTVASTPGINMIPYVSVAAGAITALNAAVKAGRDAKPYLDAIVSTFGDGKKVPTRVGDSLWISQMYAVNAAIEPATTR